MADKFKFLLALAFALAGVVGFYQLPAKGGWEGGVALAVGILLALGVLWMSASRVRFVAFVREVNVETRKVVWPTRKETFQTTGVVFAFVLIMAVFLWVADKSLEWVLYDLILGWK